MASYNIKDSVKQQRTPTRICQGLALRKKNVREKSAAAPHHSLETIRYEYRNLATHTPQEMTDLSAQVGAPEGFYSPLFDRQIRLLTLSPALRQSDPIVCNLHVVSLEGEKPIYEAISYVWGDPKVTVPIEVSNRPFQVTANLATALRRFRNVGGRRILWVDAICIDQSNDQERGHQVGLMGHLYSRARRVLVWLGEDDHPRLRAEWGMATIRAIAAISEKERIPDPKDFGVDASISDCKASVENLLSRPWWTRAWTVQESTLAQDHFFCCGQASCSGPELRDATARLVRDTNDQWRPDFNLEICLVEAFRTTTSVDKFKDTGRNLLFLILFHSSRASTLMHDKVYAFFGLSRTFTEEYAALIDYTKPYQVVFEQLMIAMIRRDGWLDALGTVPMGMEELRNDQCHGETQTLYKKPSWSPSWGVTRDRSESKALALRVSRKRKYQACAKTRASIDIKPFKIDMDSSTSLLGRMIVTSGIVIDVIEEVGEVNRAGLPHSAEFNNTVIMWGRMMDSHKLSMQRYNNSDFFWEEMFEDMCRYMSDLTTFQDALGYISELHKQTFEDWWRWKTAVEGKEYIFDAWSSSFGLRFFISKTRFLGLAPAGAKAGDKVCILLGGRKPFVLREEEIGYTDSKGDTKPFHRLLGSAYVSGLMRGEAFQRGSGQTGPRPLQTFWIW